MRKIASGFDGIILFQGGIETLEQFSAELSRAFRKWGIPTFLFDLEKEWESFRKLERFCEGANPVAITFNFNGIRGEEPFLGENGELFWDERGIPVVNIVVDHPFYYDELIGAAPRLYGQIPIDRLHGAYMRRFYPDVRTLPFLPLGGTESERGSGAPPASRRMGVVFAGNYTPPSAFDRHIWRAGKEYADFYLGIIDDLIAHPSLPMETAMEAHLTAEMGSLPERDLRDAMAHMVFIDLYVRFHFRGLAVRTLAEAGIPVHLFGAGWEKLPCKRPENLVLGGPLTSRECLEEMRDAKISLNVMPWFKDGAHDRVFSSMLNGAVSLTDKSRYLTEELRDGEECAFYSLEEIGGLPDIASGLLSRPSRMEEIAERGRARAIASHTWEERAKSLLSFLEAVPPARPS